MEKAKKNILILGAGGMLGKALCNCIKGKYKIIPLSHQDCDITDKEKVINNFRRFRPWLVIDVAAYTDVDGCQRNETRAYAVNTEGTYNIAQAARLSGAILIYVSTDYVFDGNKMKPYRETDKTEPVNVYGSSKLEGEKFVKRLLKNYIIIRTCWLFGKGRRNFVDDMLERAKSTKFLKIVNDKFASPTYVNDLARAILQIIELMASRRWRNNYYGSYHITNSGFCSWYGYAQAIFKLAGIKEVRLKPISMQEINFSARRPVFSVLDNAKYVGLTNKPLRPWQDALREYFKERRS